MLESDIHVSGYRVCGDSTLLPASKPASVPVLASRKRVPQSIFVPIGTKFPPAIRPPARVVFDFIGATKNAGIELRELAAMGFATIMSSIVGAAESAFEGSGMATVTLVLRWPGYEDYNFVKVLELLDSSGRRITRGYLAKQTSLFLGGFMENHTKMTPAGAPEWDLRDRISGGRVLLVGITHVVGDVYVPELHVVASAGSGSS